MEVRFQNTKHDYIAFYKLYLWDRTKGKAVIIIILLLVAGFVLAGSPFSLDKFIAGMLIAAALLSLITYFVPLVVFITGFDRMVVREDSTFEEKALIMSEAGIDIKSPRTAIFWNWESIISVNLNEKFVYLFLADKRLFLLPKENFSSESDITNFVGFIQTKIIRARGSKLVNLERGSRPPYLLGLLCFIPLVGAFVGFGLLMYGIFKYKDKWLIIIGAAGIAFTVFVYSSLYMLQFNPDIRSGFATISQTQINSLIGNIEFYKLKHGEYPDSLAQIQAENQTAWIDDPLQFPGTGGSDSKRSTKFNYQKIGMHYYLFSSGIDGIPHTKDDIYPEVTASDSVKFGWIKNK